MQILHRHVFLETPCIFRPPPKQNGAWDTFIGCAGNSTVNVGLQCNNHDFSKSARGLMDLYCCVGDLESLIPYFVEVRLSF